jgi:hypothetical protein
MSECLKLIRFEKGSFIAVCVKAEPVAIVATLYNR